MTVLPRTEANDLHAAQVVWDCAERIDGFPEAVELKDVVRYLKNEPLQEAANSDAYPDQPAADQAVDVWRWPVVGGAQHISVVGGELQDSEAHARRGGGPAVDLPAFEGQGLQFLTDDAVPFRWWDGAEGGYMVDYTWQGTRGWWHCRYCHMDGPSSMRAGHTGRTDGGAHLHLLLWLDDNPKRPEDQPEFQAMLT